jgi:DNA invertase Pin-like site-specific DNA recombinase
MKVALYARVSSENQVDKSLSVKDQIKALRKYASDHKYTVIEIFIDEAKSGRTDKRPKFQEMISQAKRKEPPFEAILVWKLDRFARNREHSIVYKSLLNRNGIQVISINEPTDNTASGKMLEGMLEVIGEFYSNNMSQDIKRGMEGNIKRGYFSGGVVPFGYRIKKVNTGGVTKSKLEIDEARSRFLTVMKL